jgi:cephalosporin hydroxylase
MQDQDTQHMDKGIVDAFHIEWENSRAYEQQRWLGVPIWKNPFDAFALQDIIFKVRPDYIIETGTAYGGSALFFGSILEMIGHGKVLTIDNAPKVWPVNDIAVRIKERRITAFIDSSVNPDLINLIYGIGENSMCMVVLDSWHCKDHVLQELKLYSKLVPVGSYIIVEDTHVSGHPVEWKWGDGPYEAVQDFLKENDGFEIDTQYESLGFTNNPSGYLRRIK